VKGCKRFLDRIWALAEKPLEGDELSAENEAAVHRTIKKVSQDIEEMKFNTAIAAMMSLVNQFYDTKPSRGDMKKLLQLLSPFAPHFAEELWEIQGFEGYAMESPWPDYDESKTVESVKELAVQINGKLRTTVTVAADADDSVVIETAKADGKVQKAMDGMELVRAIVVKNKLVNLILKPKK
jgi:leucyl-tRNA synthetase